MQEALYSLFVDWPWCLLTYIPLAAVLWSIVPSTAWEAPKRWVGMLPSLGPDTPEEVADEFINYFKAERADIASQRATLDKREKRLDAQESRVLKGGEA